MVTKPGQTKGQENVELIRVLGKDLRGDMKIGVGLTKIKGISWSISNAMCRKLSISPGITVTELGEENMKKIEEFAKEMPVPSFIKNRQKDVEDGKDKHELTSDLTLRNEFDIKRLRKIKSYKGIRHANRLPVRGQRTKANFRPNKKKSGKR